MPRDGKNSRGSRFQPAGQLPLSAVFNYFSAGLNKYPLKWNILPREQIPYPRDSKQKSSGKTNYQLLTGTLLLFAWQPSQGY
ncbi:hypothetical protein DMA11_19105 [Marinilabiliaceae bacterium JC017]|nr:hypothetical protein DMA11_19105 [Marinilabiliaceae bacterium JC017]